MIKDYISAQITKAQRVMSTMLADEVLFSIMVAMGGACTYCMQRGGKIFLAGNGGSAADAQHIARELVRRFVIDHPGLPVIALTRDTSILTSISNDYGCEKLFASQAQAHGYKGGVFVGYSTSGKLLNILHAFEEVRVRGLIGIGLTGNCGGRIRELCAYLFEGPSAETPRIQEGHLVLGNILFGLIERPFQSA